MITYLIQCTTIWLLSLIVFDVLLRHTNLHLYNRVYLVATLLMGLLLPLYHRTEGIDHMPVILTRSLAPAAVAEQRITQAITPAVNHAFLWSDWIIAFYIIGCAFALIILLREAIVLLRWYRRGLVENYGAFRLVSTGKSHGPFSVLRCTFISDKSLYSGEELQMILQHEGAHIHKLHFLDKTLALLMRCLFWAHPLIYLYYRRLMMVHEFEADAAMRMQSDSYAEFLIQQAFDRGSAPAIGHSFFHSPLKTRIRMLSKNNGRRWHRIACLIALPVVTAFAVLWVTKSTAHKKEQHGNIVVFGSNKFELGYSDNSIWHSNEAQHSIDSFNKRQSLKKPKQVTVGENDSSTIISTHAILMASPQKMNDEKIYSSSEQGTEAITKSGEPLLPAQIVDAAKNTLAELQDGRYAFNVIELIVDKTGHIVYYTLCPVSWYEGMISVKEWKREMRMQKEQLKKGIKPKDEHPIPEAIEQRVSAGIERFLDNAQLVPALKDGKPVIARADYLMKSSPVIVVLVKNHEVSIDHP